MPYWSGSWLAWAELAELAVFGLVVQDPRQWVFGFRQLDRNVSRVLIVTACVSDVFESKVT